MLNFRQAVTADNTHQFQPRKFVRDRCNYRVRKVRTDHRSRVRGENRVRKIHRIGRCNHVDTCSVQPNLPARREPRDALFLAKRHPRILDLRKEKQWIKYSKRIQ